MAESKRNGADVKPGWRPYAMALAVVAAITAAGFFLPRSVGERGVALIYLAAVVGMALFIGRGPVIFAATLSAALWNFLFLPPRFAFYIANFDDAMMLAIYFIVALGMGELIARLRAKERMEKRREQLASALHHLTLELGDAATWPQIERVALENVASVFNADAMMLWPDASGKIPGDFTEQERDAARKAFESGEPAGRFTKNLPDAAGMYLPLQATGSVLGVLRIIWRQGAAPLPEQRNLLDGFLRQIALVMDRQRLRESEAQARLVAESERLGRALLNSISHELRTPISAIQSATDGLMDTQVSPLQKSFADEIHLASVRLNRLVGNLLDMTRLESGRIKPRMEWCDAAELVNITRKRLEKELSHREVSVIAPPKLPFVRMDFALMEQTLGNLLLNVVAHTPAGTPVRITMKIRGGDLLIAVADRGPGIPPDALPKIFDKFFRAPDAPVGGIGLGLSIVKGFVEVQGGRITAENAADGGAAFTIAMPIGKPPEL